MFQISIAPHQFGFPSNLLVSSTVKSRICLCIFVPLHCLRSIYYIYKTFNTSHSQFHFLSFHTLAFLMFLRCTAGQECAWYRQLETSRALLWEILGTRQVILFPACLPVNLSQSHNCFHFQMLRWNNSSKPGAAKKPTTVNESFFVWSRTIIIESEVIWRVAVSIFLFSTYM